MCIYINSRLGSGRSWHIFVGNYRLSQIITFPQDGLFKIWWMRMGITDVQIILSSGKKKDFPSKTVIKIKAFNHTPFRITSPQLLRNVR